MSYMNQIQIEYLQELLYCTENLIGSLKQADLINNTSGRDFVQPILRPLLYLDSNKHIIKKYMSLEFVVLMPEYYRFYTHKVPGSICIVDYILYAEGYKLWITEQIQILKCPESINQTINQIEGNVQNRILRKFKRNELQEALKPIAEEMGLNKGEELKQESIIEICKRLKKQGYITIEKSVATALRDKLGYKKEKY
jgi:hypothetical protein